MAEDKRILKTKQRLKTALAELLAQTSFEQLTVKDICAQSSITRITFYTHYGDKYELLADLFREYAGKAQSRFAELQAQNNPEKEPFSSCANLFESMIDLYFDAAGSFREIALGESPYLHFALSKCILETTQRLIEEEKIPVYPKYGLRRTTWFFCYGLLGLIGEAHVEGGDMARTREEARGILLALLRSDIFNYPAAPGSAT